MKEILKDRKKKELVHVHSFGERKTVGDAQY